MDLQRVLVGEREHLEQSDRVLGQELLVRNREPATVEHEALESARTAANRRKLDHSPAAPRELLVEMGKKDPGQVADRLRVKEIVAHEALDRRSAGPVGIIEPRR